MHCAWDAYLRLLPYWMRHDVDKYGQNSLQELRLRLGLPPELRCGSKTYYLEQKITDADIRYCIDTASQYSPWSVASVQHGYITAQGGHRIGICGEAVYDGTSITGIRCPRMLCIRVARDFPGISERIELNSGVLLIIGRPGSGKTTLLRDMIRRYSDEGNLTVGVVDERSEIFPNVAGAICFSPGTHTDILYGCTKADGIEVMLRTMNPDILAVDEITSKQDCNALIHAGWCGVHMIATAHAGNLKDFLSRPVYRPLTASGLITGVITLHADKTYTVERMKE